MLEIFSALIALVEGLLTGVRAINSKKEKKLARNIVQIHLLLQTILDDALMVFELIKNAERKIDEHGASQYSKIIKDNLRDQRNRIHQLYYLLSIPEMSTIIRNLNRRHARNIWQMLGGKSTAIYEVLYRIEGSPLKLIDGELYAVNGRKKTVAFPNLKKQFELLKKLQDASGKLSKLILDKIKYRDLL